MTEPSVVGKAEFQAVPRPSTELSLSEMLRIMDVASALRKDRELVAEQLGFEEVKAKLRDRLIETAKVTGEEVTTEEVDAAIDRYYQRLHTFREPKFSLQVALAHLYVRRVAIAKWGGSAVAASLLVWWLFLSPRGPLTVTGRSQKRLERLSGEVARRTESVKALSVEAPVSDELSRLTREAEVLARQGDPNRLAEVVEALSALEDRLREEYTVSVVTGSRSGFPRDFSDQSGKRVSGYYLIVEARDPRGGVVERRVRNAESGIEADVTTWAERVPKEVYDRLVADKKSDGVLEETLFAVKRPGKAEEEVVMKGSDGRPLRRIGQITSW